MLTRKLIVRKLCTGMLCLFVAPVALAGFETRSKTWPNDAASVGEGAVVHNNPVADLTIRDADIGDDTDWLNLKDRKPEYKRLYVKFGVTSAVNEIRHMRNKSNPPLAALPIFQTSLNVNEYSWETGVGMKMQYLRFEAEYLHHKKMNYNPAPVVVGNTAVLNSEVTSRAVLVNMYFDFDNDNIVYFKPYIGALTGLVLNQTRSVLSGPGINMLTARRYSNYAIAWGASLGARMPFWSNWCAYFSYKYTGQGKIFWKNASNVLHIQGTYIFRGFSLGVQFMF